MNSLEKKIQAVIGHAVDEGLERGAQVAVYLRGELVANCCAGTMDATRNRQVDQTTLFPVFSTTKGITATLLHLLVEQGKITYDTPIAEVWPEFAAQGKDAITLRHALNHTSGIPLLPQSIGHAELGDWETICAVVANLRPVSPAGEEWSYHAITYGWILGEVARRIDGRSFGDLLRDEISTPLDLNEELFVGLPHDAEPRVAILEGKVDEQELERIRADHSPQAIPALVQPLHVWMNRPDARRACLPASSGIMTAHAVARHYAALLPGGVDGIELLPPARIALATEPQRPRNLKPGDPPTKHRLGYEGASGLFPAAFGHSGYGGSLGFADPVSGLAFGFARNCFEHEGALPQVLQTVREAMPG